MSSNEGQEGAVAPVQVLVVEDNIVNQKVVVCLLEKYGYQVSVANNGLEAVEQFSRSKFDLVLMDLQMPEMDGFEATREIRKLCEERQLKVPIIAVTAHAMKGDKERCLQAGMDDYVTKPINKDVLLGVIASYLEQGM